ncbi:NADPH-dependent conjugated polyketone reductase C2 [[Candida] jaroonii]|uniref:NADPH-dependent conjugated polyketone reductase C2 n=1 Tax=[Candida] jaroonii TaxID=467808 RepID=A0ACA9Y5L9_9ASCO|nr:NADPH-dependent conjugated polyketone reductase C2 [[Candida] jaroonii]
MPQEKSTPPMTQIDLKPSFKTVSGKPLLMGTGSGTKWKDMKRADASTAKIVEDQIKMTLDQGFYHIDTAEFYTTEEEVGNAVKTAKLNREDIWITTKYGPMSKTSGPVEALQNGLKALQMSYVDAYFIHVNKFAVATNGLTLETCWKQMCECKKLGLTRYLGVSNFSVESLEIVTKISKEYGDDYLPKFNQVEFHPYLQNQWPGLYDYCQSHDILIEAYGPLTPLSRIETPHPLTAILAELAKKYGKTDAQLLLRWTLQKNVLPITTSSNPERIKQALEVYDFELAEEDFDLIDKVDFVHQAFTFVKK